MHSKISIPYQWQAGDFLARFFDGLKNGVLLASICPKCRRKSLPPKRVCVRCFGATDELAPVPNSGRLVAFTRLNLDSARRALREDSHDYYSTLPCLTWGIVRFETCDTGMVHFINPAAAGRVSAGARMKAVLEEPSRRNGTILDVRYFDLFP